MSAAAGAGLAQDLVHAVAQLPDRVELEVAAGAGERAQLSLLARAYAVSDRVRDTASPTGALRWRYVDGARGDALAAGAADDLRARTLGGLVEGLWPEGESAAVERDDRLLRDSRVALVTNLPAHYRVPLFTELAARVARSGGHLLVLFTSAGDAGRPWFEPRGPLQFDHVHVRGVELPVRRHRRPSLPVEMSRHLRRHAPTSLLIAGFSPVWAVPALRHARSARIPVGVWSGEIAHAARQRPGARLRELERRTFARHVDFGVAYGSSAARYLHGLRPGLPVVIGRNTAVASAPPRPRSGAGRLDLVLVADLRNPGKGVEVVMRALRLMPEVDLRLTLIGGEPTGELRRLVDADGRVELRGMLPNDAVKEAYRASDVFLNPTQVDVFGLALVEAMAAGLAVVTTTAPGAAADLTVDGRNALVLGEHTPEAWEAAIRRLARDPAYRAELGRAAARTIDRRWTNGHAVEGMVSALRLAALSGARSRR